eukprot:gene26106-47319_t
MPSGQSGLGQGPGSCLSWGSLHPQRVCMTPLPHPAPAAAPLPTHALPSYLHAAELGAWGNYLQQVDRVIPHLGPLARW